MASGESRFITTPRREFPYAKLGQTLGSVVNPMAETKKQLIPLLFQDKMARDRLQFQNQLARQGAQEQAGLQLQSAIELQKQKNVLAQEAEDNKFSKRMKAAKQIYPDIFPKAIQGAIKTDANGVETQAPPQERDISPVIFDPNFLASGEGEMFMENPAFKIQQSTKAATAKKTAELNLKREDLRDQLESFFAVDDLIDRAKGGFIETRIAGLKSQSRALAQKGVKGFAARQHDAATKRLRVTLVRAAGDVGNLNITEQEAAERLIPGFYDSKNSAKLKRAFLKQLSKGIGINSENLVKQTLQDFMQTDEYQSGGSEQPSRLDSAAGHGIRSAISATTPLVVQSVRRVGN